MPIYLDSTPDMAGWMVTIHGTKVCVISPASAGANGLFRRTGDGRYAIDTAHLPAITAALDHTARHTETFATTTQTVTVEAASGEAIFSYDPYPQIELPQIRELELPVTEVPVLRDQLAALTIA